MRTAVLVSVSLLVFGTLAGCGSMRPSGADSLQCGLQNFEVVDDYTVFKAYLERAATRAKGQTGTGVGAQAGGNELNVLELSAGGEFGAYGAGFMVGWGRVGAGAKPIPRGRVQIVTGVSTGAIMSTFTFLGSLGSGTPATEAELEQETLDQAIHNGHFDRAIEKFYQQLSDDKVYTVRSTISLLWANSLYDASGKTHLLNTYITTDLIDQVAKAPDDHGLYIGFVNVDTGQFIRIDMVKLARSVAPKDRRDACFRAMIDASSAAEVTFQPVFVDDQMLGDGGARRHLFLVDPARLSALSPGFQGRLISLIHGDLQVDQSQPKVTNGVLQIANQSSSILIDQVLKDSVVYSQVLARDPGLVVGPENAKSLPRFDTFLAAAEQSACVCMTQTAQACGATATRGADLFCTEYMKCLSKAGETDGQRIATTGAWLQLQDLNLGTGKSCTAPGQLRMDRPRFR